MHTCNDDKLSSGHELSTSMKSQTNLHQIRQGNCKRGGMRILTKRENRYELSAFNKNSRRFFRRFKLVVVNDEDRSEKRQVCCCKEKEIVDKRRPETKYFALQGKG